MYKNGVRAMAWIVKIDHVEKHPNADILDICTVGGWKCITKLGEYKSGDLAIYASIDSFIPNTVAPFLTKDGHYPKTYEGVEGERLRTVKLRGQISQGLLLQLSEEIITDSKGMNRLDLPVIEEGADMSEFLGIVKYEPPVSAQLAGVAKGNFPSRIPKTDQERIQNLKKELKENYGQMFEIQEKLDGSSMTVYIIDGVFGVCSRNLDLKETESNTFWQVARKLNLEEKLRSLGANFAIQGELIGEGIQKNRYEIKGQDFFVFDMYNIDTGNYLLPFDRRSLCVKLDLKQCPLYMSDAGIFDDPIATMEILLKEAEGPSILNPKTEREGFVFKSNETDFTFKVISNKFLMRSEA